MSPAKRRRRGRGSSGGSEGGQQQPSGGRGAPAPLQWRTFPVYFAFALGAFIGLELGLLSANLPEFYALSISVGLAIMLGLGLSRLTTRWLLQRRLIKARKQT